MFAVIFGDDRRGDILEAMKVKERKPLDQTVTEIIVRQLARYIDQSKRQLLAIFVDIDGNGNGQLSQDELKRFLQKELGIKLEDVHFQEFFEYFDSDGSNDVSIEEFVSIIKPELEKVRKSPQPSPAYMAVVRKEVEAFVSKNENLESKFKIYEQGEFFVSQNDFFKVLKMNFVQLNDDQLEVLKELLKTNARLEVDYLHFLALGSPKFKEKYEKVNLFRKQQSLALARDVFSRIARAVKELNLDLKKTFSSFDYDKNGFISKEEFKKAFVKMKLDYTKEQVDLIFLALNPANLNEISYKEFIDALKL